MQFPFYKQHDAMDCGPTCLRMVAKFHGKSYSLSYLRDKCFLTREGVSLLGISDAAESLGMRTLSARISFEQLKEEVPLPSIVHWRQRHFVVVYRIKRGTVVVADPAHGLVKYSESDFLDGWISSRDNGSSQGVALMLEPTPEFDERDETETYHARTGLRFFAGYLKPHKKLFIQVFLSLLAGSLFGLILPFLTQSIVDFGINTSNVGFIYAILLGQLMLFVGRTTVEFIRGWIFLYIGTRMNISIISDFLAKIMKLPMPFFETKKIGDLLQRIGDNQRVQNFLTSTSINTLFSLFNLVIFGFVLALYSSGIFLIFLAGSVAASIWIIVFMKRRRELDFKRFDRMSENQSRMIQLITGMQEIKLTGSEKQKRWEWERIQARLFKVSIASLSLNQLQDGGNLFLNELKNIFISFMAATEVVEGRMTLGMMLAVQYIIGQLNAPINQLIGFAQAAQDAKISLERMGEIHNQKNEENEENETAAVLPKANTLRLSGVRFRYEGPNSPYVLDDISFDIPEGKVTAIVGTSGSGKTTLLKLLLKFYPVNEGDIRLGDLRLDVIQTSRWRQKCGVVMQDGFIFSDSIARNIAVGEESIDRERLWNAAQIANIHEFVETLPLGYNTKIGPDGHGLSQGQRQRILIARAVYKNPAFIFFDEATSSLDANNERTIMENLQEFFKGRTVVVIAHRLSTVKNADQIVVLEAGRLVECGNHADLVRHQGSYYELIKNQLELGA
jgi:ATP-binding cassette subfamily B protein